MAVQVLGALLAAGCPISPECSDGFDHASRCVSSNDGMTDGGTDVGGDVPCGGCTAPLVCDTATGECEECLGTDASSCGAAGNACVANACVACDGNDDCTDVDASLCTAGNECTGCAADGDCTHLTGTPVCDEASSTCVACTIDTEAARCGANSCDPATFACTETPRMTIRRCGACVADSECMQADDRCVPMEFMGTARAGGYCLKQFDTGCVEPFATPTPARGSLSSAASETYCGIAEGLTTCEAVRDLLDNSTCPDDTACGADGLADGRCGMVNGIANRCSYPCVTSADCPSGRLCGSMEYCGGP